MSGGVYQKPQIRSFTGMRFLAAAAVFISHVLSVFPVIEKGDLPLGGAGVSYFFLLSGFILTYVYGRREEGDSLPIPREKFSFRKFYLRRFARIWPLHLAALLLNLFLIRGIKPFFATDDATAKLLVNAALLQSWIPDREWIFPLNGVSWSLSVEAFFYLLFPFLLIGGRKRFLYKYVLIMCATITGMVVLHQWIGSQSTTNSATDHLPSWLAVTEIFRSNPLSRLLEFATGVGCGFLYFRFPQMQAERNWWRDTIFELVTLVSVVAFFLFGERVGLYSASLIDQFPTFAFWYRFAGAFPIFALLLLVFSRTRGWFTDRLSAPWIVYLGEISFSFYMVHRVVMLLLGRIELSREPVALLAGCGLSFFASLLVASVLFHLVEIPFRKLIVDAVERERPAKYIATFSNALKELVQPKRFVPLFLLTLIFSAIVFQYRFDDRDPAAIASIISDSPTLSESSQALEDPDLLGLTRQSNGNGEIVFKLVWRIGPDKSTWRFARLMDAEGEIIANAHKPKILLNRSDSEILLIDQLIIPIKKLTNSDHVDVVLRSAPRPSGKQTKGVRHQRFTLWQRDLGSQTR